MECVVWGERLLMQFSIKVTQSPFMKPKRGAVANTAKHGL